MMMSIERDLTNSKEQKQLVQMHSLEMDLKKMTKRAMEEIHLLELLQTELLLLQIKWCKEQK